MNKKSEKKNSRRMFSWMNPNLRISDTKRYGKGVFAKKDIKKDEILMVMGGYILTIKDENNLKGIIADKPIEVSDLFSIGPLKPSDLELMPQHYVNHSCDPNTGFKGQIFMVAMKKIKKGEQICFDYAMCMNPNDDSSTYFSMDCSCGSKKCRGSITEDDWKNPLLQKKYEGYFQWFLQNEISKIKK